MERKRPPQIGVDRIASTLANWDTDKAVKPAVEAELKRRGLKIRATEGSFRVEDPDGFEASATRFDHTVARQSRLAARAEATLEMCSHYANAGILG